MIERRKTMSKESNTKYINLIPFTEKDLELLEKCKSIKKKINIIFYEPSIHIYLAEEPKDIKTYEIFLSKKDINYLQKGNIIIKPIQGKNSEYRLMMKTVYDNIPKELLNEKEYLVFGVTKTYTADLAYTCQKNNVKPSLSELRKANNMLPPLWNV